MLLAPITLFVYNRPDHTRKTLDALAANSEAKESELFIFCDGPKRGVDEITLSKIKEVRALVEKEDRFKKIHITLREENIGLANSIVTGVTEIVNTYGTVIVLEDDIVVSQGFLKYMNDALSFYKGNSKVMHISGYMYPHKEKLPETFFFKTTLCWGWATWKDSWVHLNNSAIDLWNHIQYQGRQGDLDALGSNYLSKQLACNITGDLNTWFVKWHASVVLKDGLTLFPGKSLVDNIGFDNSGVHTRANNFFNHSTLSSSVNIASIDEVENPEAKAIIKLFYANFLKSGVENSSTFKLKKFVKKLIYRFLPELKKIKERELSVRNINSFIGSKSKVYPKATVFKSIVGNYTYISENSVLKNTIVGKFCSVGPNLISGWGIHPVDKLSTHPMFYSMAKQNGMTLATSDKIKETAQITIGNDVFIGMNVSILDGVTIGNGAIIGAGAVVSKNIPPYAIAIGNPIKIINYRFSPEQIEKLNAIAWWDFPEDHLEYVERGFENVDDFIKETYTKEF